MAIPADTPLTFDLPDGQIQLCSWAFIVSQLTPFLNAVKSSLDSQNISLQQIDEKLQSWIEENN